MEIHCKIIEDLLPLYAEGLVSEETAAAVEAHVSQCERCRKSLEQLRTPPHVIPLPTETLKKISHEIRRRRSLTALFCVLLTATLFLSVFLWMYQPVYLSTWEAVSEVVAKDNTVTVYFTPEAERCRFTEEIDPDTGRKSVTLMACKRTWDLYRNDTTSRSPMTFEDVSQVWYASTDSQQEDTLLWGQPHSGGRISLPWLGMRFYQLLALLTGFVFGVIWLISRKKKLGKLVGTAAVFLLCYAVCAAYATGGSLLIYAPQDRPIIFFLTGLLAAFAGGTILTGRQLCLVKKKDKAI